ncbi:G-protein coupled receptor 182-like [Chanos chanos]|uniref:G-protein coupled receptor 182-like n=1 Tax=Chanos chanos TaxID=29144 RepID=A0A6J2VQ23_CHACN|nr:G-protein coupled receptor 182-like [Chanos chanos]
MDDHHYHHDNSSEWLFGPCNYNADYNSRRIGLFLVHLFLFVGGLVVNAVVVWVNWRRRHSRNTVIFCLLNMGVSDLMILTMVPFYMLDTILDHVWLWGEFLCRFSNLIFVLNIYSSSFFLVYMTVERYLTVRRGSAPKPWGVSEKRKRTLICAGLWTLSLFLSLLETVHVQVLDWEEPGCYIVPLYDYVGWYTSLSVIFLLFQFLGPAAIIVTFNILTARAVQASPEVQGGSSKNVWLLHVYSLVYIICWLPINVNLLLMVVDFLEPTLFDCDTTEHLIFGYAVLQAVSLLHSIANPILYSLLSRSFRSHLIRAIVQHLPKEALATKGTLNHGNSAAQGEGATNGGKAREMSESSTSHSDVDS